MQTSPVPDTDFEFVISPQRLKIAATSSAVVPATNPPTSTTFPFTDEPAPLIDSWLGFEEAVASRSAFCVIVFRLTLGAAGLSVRRAERELDS